MRYWERLRDMFVVTNPGSRNICTALLQHRFFLGWLSILPPNFIVILPNDQPTKRPTDGGENMISLVDVMMWILWCNLRSHKIWTSWTQSPNYWKHIHNNYAETNPSFPTLVTRFGSVYHTKVFSRRLRWMKEGQRDVGWRVTARVHPPTNFNIQPSLPSINSAMETEKEGNIIGGKLPRSPWPEAGWGLQCVCPEGVRGRRQHPGRTFGTVFPAVLATLLLRLHKSLPAGSMLLSPGGFPIFPKTMPS